MFELVILWTHRKIPEHTGSMVLMKILRVQKGHSKKTRYTRGGPCVLPKVTTDPTKVCTYRREHGTFPTKVSWTWTGGRTTRVHQPEEGTSESLVLFFRGSLSVPFHGHRSQDPVFGRPLRKGREVTRVDRVSGGTKVNSPALGVGGRSPNL